MESLLGFEEVPVENEEQSSTYSRKLVPWSTWSEWLFVSQSIFSDSPDSVAAALRRVSLLSVNNCSIVFMGSNCRFYFLAYVLWFWILDINMEKQRMSSSCRRSYSSDNRNPTKGSLLHVCLNSHFLPTSFVVIFIVSYIAFYSSYVL